MRIVSIDRNEADDGWSYIDCETEPGDGEGFEQLFIALAVVAFTHAPLRAGYYRSERLTLDQIKQQINGDRLTLIPMNGKSCAFHAAVTRKENGSAFEILISQTPIDLELFLSKTLEILKFGFSGNTPDEQPAAPKVSVLRMPEEALFPAEPNDGSEDVTEDLEGAPPALREDDTVVVDMVELLRRHSSIRRERADSAARAEYFERQLDYVFGGGPDPSTLVPAADNIVPSDEINDDAFDYSSVPTTPMDE